MTFLLRLTGKILYFLLPDKPCKMRYASCSSKIGQNKILEENKFFSRPTCFFLPLCNWKCIIHVAWPYQSKVWTNSLLVVVRNKNLTSCLLFMYKAVYLIYMYYLRSSIVPSRYNFNASHFLSVLMQGGLLSIAVINFCPSVTGPKVTRKKLLEKKMRLGGRAKLWAKLELMVVAPWGHACILTLSGGKTSTKCVVKWIFYSKYLLKATCSSPAPGSVFPD